MATLETDPEPQAEPGIGDLLGQLVDDARAYGQAELDYYHKLARGKLREARAGLWWGAAAAGLALATSVGLIVGLVFTLSAWVGPGWATLIVVVAGGGIAALMGRLAWLQVKKVLKGK